MLTPTQPRQTPLGKKFTVPKNLTAKQHQHEAPENICIKQ